MGMAAAQAKLLSLTARRSDINYQLSSLMRGKLDLMTQASNAADALSAAQRNNNIFVMTTSDNQQTQLSFNSLSKEGLTIVDAKGRTIVPSSYRGNVKGLANVLPASHPAVKSYDGDFVPKTKLTKNYVSIPENTIPMFAETDPENREQKTVKAAQGEPTVQTKYEEQDAIYSNLTSYFLSNNDDVSDYLYRNYYNSGMSMLIRNTDNTMDKSSWFSNGILNTTDVTEIDFNDTDFKTKFDNIFQTELNDQYCRNFKNSISDLNRILFSNNYYTKYADRTFQNNLSYSDSDDFVNKNAQKTGKEIIYVSNAEQFITALLKNATVTNEVLKSDANIMLLNDIDLDDMLEKNGKGGLKAFIQNEISTLDLDNVDNTKKTAYNNALDNFINLTQVDTSLKENTSDEHSAIRKSLTTNLSKTFYNLAKAYGINVNFQESNNNDISNSQCIINTLASMNDDEVSDDNQELLRSMAQDAQQILNEEKKNASDKIAITLNDCSKMTKDDLNDWDKIAERLQAAAAAAAVGGTKSKKSGIDASVLAHIYSKYFSGGTNDKFDEEFTNFIQIDQFTGTIGGGGFAINNLKMATTGTQFAGMFGIIENDDTNADSNVGLHGIWMDNANVINYKTGTQNDENNNAAIVAKNIKGAAVVNDVSVVGQQLTTNESQYNKNKIDGGNDNSNSLGNAAGLLWALQNRQKNQPNKNLEAGTNTGWGVVTNDLRDRTKAYGYQQDGSWYSSGWNYKSLTNYAFAKSGNYGTRAFIRNKNRNHFGVREMGISSTTGNNIRDGASEHFTVHISGDHVNGKNQTNVGAALFMKAGNSSSKFAFYKKEDVKSYTEPKDDTWKNGAKFDDGTVVDWQDWDVVDGFNSETGEYTLAKKHGEETEEYLQIKDLLEFYKEQNVRVEYDENRETGCFTYSASGYSIDVEYKEDLNKYLSDNYLYKVENNDSSIVVYERDKVVDIDSSQLVFVDDIEAVLDKNIKNGVWFVQGASVSDASKYERKSLDEIGISETTDEKADAVAQAEYDRKIREIEIQEEKYDAQITELESTLKGIEQEIENQEKIVKQNIQSSFSTFSS